jgi:hypothetical protein
LILPGDVLLVVPNKNFHETYTSTFLWTIYPYMGEASGCQLVPDPSRLIGRLREYEWIMEGIYI